MLRCSGFNLAWNTVQTFIQKCLQGPASAIAGKHIQVVDMDIGLSVSIADFRRINIVEPIVSNNLPGNVENQTAQRVALVGIGVHTPVQMLQVLIHRAFNINEAAASITGLCALFAVNNISTQGLTESGIKERVFYGILNLFNSRSRNILLSQTVHHFDMSDAVCGRGIEFTGGFTCFFEGGCNL